MSRISFSPAHIPLSKNYSLSNYNFTFKTKPSIFVMRYYLIKLITSNIRLNNGLKTNVYILNKKYFLFKNHKKSYNKFLIFNKNGFIYSKVLMVDY